MSVEGFPTSGRLGTFTVCTSGTHPASPVVGDSLFETDTGKFLQYQSATTGWTPPWNSDFGNMGLGTATSTQSGITTIADLTSLTVTFTAIGNRRYKVTGTVFLSNTTALDGCLLTLANGAGTALQTWAVDSATANQVVPVTPVFVVLGLAAGSQTLKFRLTNRTGGTAGSSAAASLIASISVDDDGSNGAPL